MIFYRFKPVPFVCGERGGGKKKAVAFEELNSE
jgi:hypothetical protein